MRRGVITLPKNRIGVPPQASMSSSRRMPAPASSRRLTHGRHQANLSLRGLNRLSTRRWNLTRGLCPQPQPRRLSRRLPADEDEYSMSDESLGEATAMSMDDIKRLFEVKKVEEFTADDPHNPRNMHQTTKHTEE